MDNRMENSNSEQFHAVMDGTVVKPPYTGVQNSVQHEIAAELRALKGVHCTALSLEGSPVAEVAKQGGVESIEIRSATGSVWRRILWQQTMLPKLLKKIHADVFHAFAYTMA